LNHKSEFNGSACYYTKKPAQAGKAGQKSAKALFCRLRYITGWAG